MVLWQLRSLDHLNTSEFGRPFPRHGLQLLFWFSNHCVSFELNNSGDVMKLVSECQPEKGVYGFHKFGNVEELLPVLYKPKKNKSIRQRLGSLGKWRGLYITCKLSGTVCQVLVHVGSTISILRPDRIAIMNR
ncbi:hypothetical protein ATANTOWER_006452 [Ataeniobius toweri]|uniref:Uncharacterized protein n=1 Tax=Ataeniobius toweri TaxID=208326 RepID=A0ABU7BX37_9TELE|nr:hypothetical protein [Ataeniobius toweri]